MAPYKSRKVVKRPVKKRQPRKVSQAKRNHVPTFMSKVSRWNKSFGFPDRLVVKLRYDDIKQLTMTSGALGLLQFNMNSIFDPDITGTGHQPMYFDQYCAMYDHYTVLKSMIKVTVVANTQAALIFSLGQDDDTSISAATSSTIWERPGFQTKVVNTPIQPNDTVLWSRWDAKKTFGGDPKSDPDLQGTASANPTEQTYYVIYFDGSVNIASTNVTVLVEIWYESVWDEFVSMTQS